MIGLTFKRKGENEMRQLVAFVLVLMLLIEILSAQPPTKKRDPFLGDYILGHSAEMYMVWAPWNIFASDSCYHQIFDFESGTYDIKPEAQHIYSGYQSGKHGIWGDGEVEVATGDFNVDNYDDVIVAWEGFSNNIHLMIPVLEKENLAWDHEHFATQKNLLSKIDYSIGDVYGQIRIIVGDFDDDSNKEFVTAYIDSSDSTFKITLFETDADLNIIALDSVKIDVPEIECYYARKCAWDITAGDYDDDGLDEI